MVYEDKEGRYRRRYMLALPLLWVVTFPYLYLLIKEKYVTLYVRSSCIFTTSYFTDKNE